MLTAIMYWIVVPSCLAFFAGYSAHAFKQMTANDETESSGPTSPPDEDMDVTKQPVTEEAIAQ